MHYLTDPKNYNSNWEWTKSNSNYHFDDSIADQPGEWFKVIGSFVGNWFDDLNKIIKESHGVNWETRKPVSKLNAYLDIEEYDIISAGGDPKGEVVNFNELAETYKSTKTMSDFFGLENMQSRLHVQLTGQMWHRHIDKLYKFDKDNPDEIVRITVMLTDWVPGQFYQYGTCHYERWKAGDVHIFDWRDVPHSTANTSFEPRVSLQLTGVKTDRTRTILSNDNFICRL